MPYKDPKKQSEYNKTYLKKHYLNNTKYYKDKAIKYKQESIKWYKEYKKQFRCINCGESDPRCIDFHHKNPKNKFMDISQLAVRGHSKKSIINEINKCDPLCSNCHRKITIKEY